MASPSHQQPSSLLRGLVDPQPSEQRLTVLNIGPALPETVTFFSDYPCKLYFADLFDALPLELPEDSEQSLDDHLEELLQLPRSVSVDLCLFWDLFDYLSTDALAALVRVLRHHLHRQSRGHAFTVRNPRTPPAASTWAIRDLQSLQVRPFTDQRPGYNPHSQRQLQSLLNCFTFERSVLLENGRLELLLNAKL